MICAGIDAGSRTLKVVLVEPAGHRILAAGVRDQGIDQDALAGQLLGELLSQLGRRRADVAAIVATGYGRRLIHFADAAVTEVTCQGWGVRQCVPDAHAVIDIGGQDSKVLRLEAGRRRGGLRDERPLRRGHRPVSGGPGGPAGRQARWPWEPWLPTAAEPPRSAACAWCSPRRRSSACWLPAWRPRTSWPASRPRSPRGWWRWRGEACRTRSCSPAAWPWCRACRPRWKSALGKPVVVAPDPQLTCALGAAILRLATAGRSCTAATPHRLETAGTCTVSAAELVTLGVTADSHVRRRDSAKNAGW